MIACMNEQPIIGELPAHDQTTSEACESLIVCLNDRRFVVVRKDAPSSLRPIANPPIANPPIPSAPIPSAPIHGDWPILERLRAGDEVVYKGEKAIVRAVERYR